MKSEEAKELAKQIQVGAYDLHVHSKPSPFERGFDGFEVIRQANKCGMAGVLLKSHYEPTATRAQLINDNGGFRTKAYGGLVLNWPVGGLNIYAVENALKVGARIIWMPTRDSANCLRYGDMEGDFFRRPGISICREDGRLRKEVYQIIDLVREKGAVLATGHISPEESIQLCKEARKMGARIVLTHPEFPRTRILADTQKEMADSGVMIEKNWFNIASKTVSAEEMAQCINTVGCEHIYIATDRGQKGSPSPAEEYRNFITALLEQGLTKEQLTIMTHTVPESIVKT